jgi:hypothetical protein
MLLRFYVIVPHHQPRKTHAHSVLRENHIKLRLLGAPPLEHSRAEDRHEI